MPSTAGKARQKQMASSLAGKGCSKLWFVLLANLLSCFLVINYSTLIGNKTAISCLITNSLSANTESNMHAIIKNLTQTCKGRYIYIHDLPSQFNEEILKDCSSITRSIDTIDMCSYIENLGFGPRVENSDGILSNSSWFNTCHFSLELVFHSIMKNYKCLTNDSSLASAIYVPFYAGLDLRRHLWGFNTRVRDSSGLDLVKWLADKPEWKRMWGMDHFLVFGRVARDLRRQSDKNAEWGSNFRFLPESVNISMLSVESSYWNNDFSIPYPSYFHPSKDNEVLEWQDRMRRQIRPYLFCFVGAPRPKYKSSIRGVLIEQCLASTSLCKFLNCRDSATSCDSPANVMEVFQSSVFCLQPPGDTFTRRSIFDSILAGCIPVFFHPGSAYAQYLWHLPKNHTKYSVFIPEKKLRKSEYRINETLLGLLKEDEIAMREEVIGLIPRIIYADPTSKLKTFEDAFDIAVKGILEKIETLRKSIEEGRDPRIGFADRNDLKFKLPEEVP